MPESSSDFNLGPGKKISQDTQVHRDGLKEGSGQGSTGKVNELQSGQETIGKLRSTEARFQESIGLNKLPLKGMVELTVKRAEWEAQRGEGVSRAQNVCFTNESGERLFGAQYSNSTGTYLKTRGGETYVVNAEPTGIFLLASQANEQVQFAAVRLTVLPNLLGPVSEGEIAAKINMMVGTTQSDMSSQCDNRPREVEIATLASSKLQTLNPLQDANIAPALVSNPAAELPTRSQQVGSAAIQDIVAEPTLKQITPVNLQNLDVTYPVANHVATVEGQSGMFEPIPPPARSASTPEDPEEGRITSNDFLDEELIKQKIKKRKDEQRRRYVVKDKDTLSSIALKEFRDVRLAELIFEINKHLIPVKIVRGRPVKQLKPRLVIFLPAASEVEAYRNKS